MMVTSGELLSAFFSWLEVWGEELGAIGSIATGLLLAILYYLTFRSQNEQVETMKSQAEVMEDQLSWMASQQQPDIWIRECWVHSGKMPPYAGNNDYLAVKLANEGTGSAKYLKARCDVWVPREDNQRSLVKAESESFSIDNSSFTLKPGTWNISRTDVSSAFHQRVHGDVLHPNEANWFITQAQLMLYPDEENGHSVSFQEAMLLLWAAGEKNIMFQLTLLYRDPAGNLDGEIILSGQGDLDDAFALESFSPYGDFSGSVGEVVDLAQETGYPPFR